MHMRVVRGGLIALPLLAGIVVSASNAFAAPLRHSLGGIGIRLVDGSSNSSSDPLARSYIVGLLTPGTTIRRRIEISNTTRSTADVAVYPAAAGLRDGKFGFASGHRRNELSSWTSVTRHVVSLPPGTNAFETVTIKVPKLASPGERYAVVWAEVSAPTSAAHAVKLVNRVGVRMYVSIGPGGAPSSNFAIGALSAKRSATGVPLVVASVYNSGGRTLDINGTLTLSNGPGGLRAGPFVVTLGATLAPGHSEPATVALDKRLPRGPWRAHLRLTSGFILRSVAATITFPPFAGASRPSRSNDSILVVSALLALLAVGALALSRVQRLASGREPNR
jgi:hypothetical protein